MSQIHWRGNYFELDVDPHWKAETVVTFLGNRPKAVLCVQVIAGSPDKVLGAIMSCLPATNYVQATTFVPASTAIPGTNTFRFYFPASCTGAPRQYRITPLYIRNSQVCDPDITHYPDFPAPSPAPPAGAGPGQNTLSDACRFNVNASGSEAVHISIEIRDPSTGGGGGAVGIPESLNSAVLAPLLNEIERISDDLDALKKSTSRSLTAIRKQLKPAPVGNGRTKSRR